MQCGDLRRLFAENDVEVRDEGEREGDGRGVRNGPLPARGQDAEERFEEAMERGFTDEPEGEAGDRDAELGRGDAVVKVVHRPLQGRRPRHALLDEFLDPRFPDGDEGELRGDEEAVDHHEDRNGGESEDHLQERRIDFGEHGISRGKRPRPGINRGGAS